MDATVNLGRRDYALWWLVGPIATFVGIGILFFWIRRHPDDSRRRAAAGYPLAKWEVFDDQAVA